MMVRATIRRRVVWTVALAGGAVALCGVSVTLFNGLALADQPGAPLNLTPVEVSVATDAVVPVDPSPTPAAGTPSSDPASSPAPTVVPAPAPVVVDDHGGDNPDHVEDSGSGSGGSGSSGSGSGGSGG